MPERSAGLLIYRRRDDGLEVLLVHPGGPFWRHKDVGAWQIPKGRVEPGETAVEAAMREAMEELGTQLAGSAIPLGEVRQAGGKYVEAFALEAEVDADAVVSNMFEIEWPRSSGQMQSFPEVDAARWYQLGDARAAMLKSQLSFLDRLEQLIIEPT